jgi:hypothetical protein
MAKFLPALEKSTLNEQLAEPVFAPPSAAEKITNLPALRAALAELEQSPWPELARLVPAQATIAFANQLSNLAVVHHANVLDEYASQLRRAAETLDLEAAGKLLQNYPRIVSHFSSSHA